MRNLTKLAFGRVVIVSLAILLQIGFVLAGVFFLNESRHWFYAASTAISWLAVIIIISGQSNPSYKIAWILLLLAFPVAGLTVYLLFGGNKTSSRAARKMQRICDSTRHLLDQDAQTLQDVSEHNEIAYNYARYLYRTSYYPIYQNTKAKYYPIGEACFCDMLQALEQAEHYIFLEYFILDRGSMWDTILDILCRKASQGVDVRVLYDDFGCITRLPARYDKKLRQCGIRAHAVHPFLPVLSGRLNNRDHRKLMIIDGKVGFTGGINLADEYINVTHPFGHWKDCGLRLEGEGVWSMTVMFLTMWDYVAKLEEDIDSFRPHYPTVMAGLHGFVQPFADSPLDLNDVSAVLFQSMIQNARRTVYIMTPYLIIDDKMTSALCIAAKTGVDVRLITPGTPDKWYVHAVTRANYEVLTESGVRVFEYKPGFIHSKVCLADDMHAMVGTVNLDFRSLYLHFEDSVYLCDNEAVTQISADFHETFPNCREITYARCRHVHLYQRVMRSLLRLFSPLM
ncbi:MAG: cardiolipin synthase [Oscillospiraceae bacterium]|nr:cardiolipin synthase [Oscillospiraceae bacterium]